MQLSLFRPMPRVVDLAEHERASIIAALARLLLEAARPGPAAEGAHDAS
jgi:hypothetical protein